MQGSHQHQTPSGWRAGAPRTTSQCSLGRGSSLRANRVRLFGSEPFLDLISSIMWSHSPAPLGKEEVTGHQPNPAAAAAAKSLQSCSILFDPIDGSPPGSSIPRIFQARTLEWVAISFSHPLCQSFPGGSGGKESTCQCRRHRFNP